MGIAIPQILIVGLGNLPLPMTRHSVGQYIIDSLASRLGLKLVSDKRGQYAHGQVNIGESLVNVCLFKSKHLMNVSGPSIADILRNSLGSPSSMIVVHDSLDHKTHTVSVKFGGSANGHNGTKSIISALGGRKEFHRLRIGIGRDGTDPADYVLRKLPSHERAFWSANGEGVDMVMTEIEKIVCKLPG